MTENEAIEIHIAENIHRIEVIENCMHTMPDADKETCKKNIKILTTVNGLLQEIQQYRALEQKLQSVYGEHDGLLKIIVNSLVNYENAPDKAIKAVLLTDDDVDKWEQYKAIGTVEECNAAMEKTKPKKTLKHPNEVGSMYRTCSVCRRNTSIRNRIDKFCSVCGQAVEVTD